MSKTSDITKLEFINELIIREQLPKLKTYIETIIKELTP